MDETTSEYVTCSCCGKGIADTPEENLDHATRGQDTGYGNCRECFGEPPAKGERVTMDEATVKRRLGWAGRTFYESRFDTVRKSLTPDNQAKWDACAYGKKVLIISQLIEKGRAIQRGFHRHWRPSPKQLYRERRCRFMATRRTRRTDWRPCMQRRAPGWRQRCSDQELERKRKRLNQLNRAEDRARHRHPNF